VQGGWGNDTLYGDAGADRLEGGWDNDIYFVEAGDLLVEKAGQGVDIVYASTSFALAAGVEVETLTVVDPLATAAINLTGNEFAQALIGNAGANILDGGGGADAMTGGQGDDVYIVDSAGDTIVEQAGGGTDEIRTALAVYSIAALANVENLTGTSSSAQTLTGNAGANVLRSGGQAAMIGGGGDDIYYVAGANDTVTEAAGGGVDEIRTALATYSIAALANVENLAGTSDQGQTLTGNAAANVLRGGTGNDIFTGGAGDDSYYVRNAGDSVVEASGGGNDRVYASVDYTLAAGQSIETLSTDNDAGTQAIVLHGNEFGNSLIGNAGANQLFGMAGNDRIDGGAGNDILTGGAGQDRLTGGAGADLFVYTNVTDSVVEAWRSDGAKFLPDTILDFQPGVDKIDLSTIDAIAGTPGDDAFTFIGAAAFSHHAGELRAEIHDGYARIFADVDGDGAADMQITVHTTVLQASDFVL
jgi:serralysin